MKIFTRSFILSAVAMMLGSTASAEIPAGYYDSCEGKTGQALLTALYQKISSHTNVGYDGLWEVYKKSDVRSDGSLWDIYTTKDWGSNFTKCGNYKVIGDCINREHSMPKSVWGGGSSAQYSDAFHLYPTDGKVNGQRSNYPYGECANGTRLPNNGSVQALGRLGNCTFSGYTGTVFEPDDEYKGDLARSYFYMAACYNNLISGWTKGEMGNMMGGNNYPVFKTWAVNLLLKWARQDEVSQKELDRNDAIYGFQKNRNPFIDHPELVEYIWGDKVGQAWYVGASAEQPDILQPVQNVTVDMGIAAVNVEKTYQITVKTKAVTGNVNLSVYDKDRALSLSATTISAAQANAGYVLTVKCLASKAGSVAGTLSISADDMEREVDITCTVVDGLPIYDAQNVSSDEFTVRWVSLGDAANYTLNVCQGNQSIAGYPKSVNAAAESYTVTNLDPLTTYTFQLTSAALASAVKTVTTADLQPNIDLMFDGNLHFDVAPGQSSGAAELLLDVENVSDDISVSVKSPFQVSTDKSSWANSLVLSADEDRFYLRVGATAEGEYETVITLTAGSYVADDAVATASVVDPNSTMFLEDWEEVVDPTNSVKAYSSKAFKATMCEWAVNDGGFGTDTRDKSFNGSTTLRMGKTATSSIAMDEDKSGGLGVVSFEAAKWGTDADAVVAVEYSTDGGQTWILADNVTVSKSDADTYSVDVSQAGSGRVRFRQTSGSRWLIDNIAISNFTELSAVERIEYHSWDAFSRNSQLVIESRDGVDGVSVYGVDGITWVNSRSFAAGEHTLELPAGLYIVVSGDFARRVLVK